MGWIIFAVLIILAILPSAEDRECGDRWQKLLDEMDAKRVRGERVDE